LRTKRQIIALLAGFAAIVAAGCGSGNTGATVVHVVPEEFFTGDLKRLEPHLEMFAACVKLNWTGPPMKLHLTIEEFENGKPHELGGSESAQDPPNEISVTLKPLKDSDSTQKKSHVVVAVQNEHRSTHWVLGMVPVPKTSTTRGTLTIDVTVPTLSGPSLPMKEALGEPADLTPDHPVALLGWFEGRGASSISGGETIAQKAARVEWALVLKLELR
jgi:hypothetical protein